MVVIGRDRYEAGQLAERELNPDCFLLDDGYQHLKLRRDLSILLLDGRNPFGNGWTLPAGVLREPRSAIRRADIIVLTRCNGEGQLLPEAPAGVPVLSARHHLSGIVPLSGGEIQTFSVLFEENVLAFAGIAAPDRFFSGLADVGVDVVGSISLPDHAVYDDRTIAGIQQLFRSTGATCLVTTAKDAVKLGQRRKLLGRVWVAQMEMILADPTVLEAKVDSLFQVNGKSA
jgi:tetraacyldisaccharide 4'-kinase